MSGFAEQAVRTLKSVGLGGLMAFDGCACGHCQVMSFSIDTACKRGILYGGKYTDMVIRVYSRYMGTMPSELQLVAEEVVRQMRERYEYHGFIMRFCDDTDDRDRRCIYCHKPRAEPLGYLCQKHLQSKETGNYVGVTIPEQYDYSKINLDGLRERTDPEASDNQVTL